MQTAEGATRVVQHAIGKAAIRADLTLISNVEEGHDLESVFLRLVDTREVPA